MVNIFRFESRVEDWVSKGQIVNNYTDRNFSDYYFGYSISLSTDGQVVAVGHPGKTSSTYYAVDDDYDPSSPGLTSIFRHDGENNWTQVGEPIVGEVGAKSGTKISLSGDGTVVAIISAGDYVDYYSPDVGNLYYINRHVEIYHLDDQDVWVRMGTNIEYGILDPLVVALSTCGMYVTITFGYNSDDHALVVFKFNEGDDAWEEIDQNSSWEIYGNSVLSIEDVVRVVFKHSGRELSVSGDGMEIVTKQSDSFELFESVEESAAPSSPPTSTSGSTKKNTKSPKNSKAGKSKKQSKMKKSKKNSKASKGEKKGNAIIQQH